MTVNVERQFDLGMPHRLLDKFQILALLEKLRCEVMSKGIGGVFRPLDQSTVHFFLKREAGLPENRYPREPAKIRQSDWIAVCCREYETSPTCRTGCLPFKYHVGDHAGQIDSPSTG